jgi:hypothetical protein
VPPMPRAFLMRSAPAWERLGLWASPGFSGVFMVEAVKQVYAAVPGKRTRRQAVRPGLVPVPALRRTAR